MLSLTAHVACKDRNIKIHKKVGMHNLHSDFNQIISLATTGTCFDLCALERLKPHLCTESEPVRLPDTSRGNKIPLWLLYNSDCF